MRSGVQYAEGDDGMNHVDLHIHSACSDSSLTVAQILSLAGESRMQMISITDHDTFAAYQHIPYDTLPCTLIKGIEISAYDHVAKRQVHILGYGFGEATPHVDALCEAALRQRNSISLWQVQQLINHGYQLTMEEVKRTAKQATAIYKQHIMDVMMRHGYSDAIYSDVYRKLFKNNGICVCPTAFVSVEAAIRAIHKDQGIAVLAHPYSSRVSASIPEYVQIGLDGIETWHSSHGQKQVDDLHAIAKRYKLIETGGSDTHGRYGEEPALGQVNPFMKDEDVSVCSRM